MGLDSCLECRFWVPGEIFLEKEGPLDCGDQRGGQCVSENIARHFATEPYAPWVNAGCLYGEAFLSAHEKAAHYAKHQIPEIPNSPTTPRS